MSEHPLQDLANAHELPVDESLFDLLREAILLRRRALEMELGSCRQRVEAIERRYGLPRNELAEAINSGKLDLSPAEARLWFTELLTLQTLRRDIDRLAQIRLIRQLPQSRPDTGQKSRTNGSGRSRARRTADRIITHPSRASHSCVHDAFLHIRPAA